MYLGEFQFLSCEEICEPKRSVHTGSYEHTHKLWTNVFVRKIINWWTFFMCHCKTKNSKLSTAFREATVYLSNIRCIMMHSLLFYAILFIECDIKQPQTTQHNAKVFGCEKCSMVRYYNKRQWESIKYNKFVSVKLLPLGHIFDAWMNLFWTLLSLPLQQFQIKNSYGTAVDNKIQKNIFYSMHFHSFSAWHTVKEERKKNSAQKSFHPSGRASYFQIVFLFNNTQNLRSIIHIFQYIIFQYIIFIYSKLLCVTSQPICHSPFWFD